MDVFVIARALLGSRCFLLGIVPRFHPQQGWTFSAVMKDELSSRWRFTGIDGCDCQDDALRELDYMLENHYLCFDKVEWFISRPIIGNPLPQEEMEHHDEKKNKPHR